MATTGPVALATSRQNVPKWSVASQSLTLLFLVPAFGRVAKQNVSFFMSETEQDDIRSLPIPFLVKKALIQAGLREAKANYLPAFFAYNPAAAYFVS